MNRCSIKYDFCVLIDEEKYIHNEEFSNSESLVYFLKDKGFRGWYRKQDLLPGANIKERIRSASIESDYVIYMLRDKPSADFLEEMMHRIPERKDMSIIIEDGTDLDQTGPLSALSIIEKISTSDPEWKNKMLKRLMTTNTDKELVELYSSKPHEFYSPVHQLFKQNSMIQLPPQTMSITESTHTFKTRELLKLLDEVLKESDHPGARILVEGQAGMGKTWMMCNLAKEWADIGLWINRWSGFEHPSIFKKFSQVYLIPVRHINNHAENIERIICHDLKIVSDTLESDVRRQIKFNSKNIMFLIDGYDEMKEKEKKKSTIQNLIKGDIAQEAIVIVTTRPHDTKEVKAIMQGNQTRLCATIEEYELEWIQGYLQDTFPHMALDDFAKSPLGEKMMGKPLFLSLQCYIWECKKQNSDSSTSTPTYNTETSVLDALWGIMLGVKDDKEGRTDKLIFYESFRDNKLPNDVRRLVEELAKTAFQMVKDKEFHFTNSSLLDLNELGSLGVIDIDVEGKCQFVHNVFLEHCAAFHLVINQSRLLKKFLSQHQANINILKYAVGMEPSILKDIAKLICRPLQCVAVDKNFLCDVDFQFQEEILRECQDDERAKLYAKTLAIQPIKTDACDKDTVTESQRVTSRFTLTLNNRVTSRPADIIRLIGREACLVILQAANPKLVVITGNTPEIQLPTSWNSGLEVSSSMMLASLYAMNINQIRPLHLYNVNQDVLKITKEWMVKGTKWYEIDEINIMNPVKSSQHLRDLLNTVVLKNELRLLTLNFGEPNYHQTYYNKWEENLKTSINVEKLIIHGVCSLRDVTTVIAQLRKVNTLHLDMKHLRLDSSSQIRQICMADHMHASLGISPGNSECDYDIIDGVTEKGLSMVELININYLCFTHNMYILLKWLSDITDHLLKLDIRKDDTTNMGYCDRYPNTAYHDQQERLWDVLPLKIDLLTVPQKFCLETPLLECIDVGRLDCWKDLQPASGLCFACPVSVSMKRLCVFLQLMNKSNECFDFSIETNFHPIGDPLNIYENIAVDGLHIIANTAVTTEFADLLFHTLKLRPSKLILTLPHPSTLLKEDGFNLLGMYPSLAEHLRELYVKNGRISLEEIHNFLQLHTQHHEVTGGKWDKVTLGTGTNIAAAAAKIDIEQKVNVAIMEIQTRMTWHCLISLLRICQLDTLYLHRDVYHTSNELRDLSVDMTNTKVILAGTSAAELEPQGRYPYQYSSVFGATPAATPATSYLWLCGMTITNAREVQIPEDTSPENKEYVERCFGSETPMHYLSDTNKIKTNYPLTKK